MQVVLNIGMSLAAERAVGPATMAAEIEITCQIWRIKDSLCWCGGLRSSRDGAGRFRPWVGSGPASGRQNNNQENQTTRPAA
jgi:hypothetical protein